MPPAPSHQTRLLILLAAPGIIALILAALWVWLPIWAPVAVVRHSPWLRPMIRALMAQRSGETWTACELRDAEADAPGLAALFLAEQDGSTRDLIGDLLDRMPSASASAVMLAGLQATDRNVRIRACIGLALLHDHRSGADGPGSARFLAIGSLIAALGDSDAQVAGAAADALRRALPYRDGALLIAAATTDDQPGRRAIEVLTTLEPGCLETVPMPSAYALRLVLEVAARDPDLMEAVDATRHFTDASTCAPLLEAMQGDDRALRIAAIHSAWVLGRRDDDALSRLLASGLTRALDDADAEVRTTAAAVLYSPDHLREWHLPAFFAPAMVTERKAILHLRSILHHRLADRDPRRHALRQDHGAEGPTTMRIDDGQSRLLAALRLPWLRDGADPADDSVADRALALVRWDPSLLPDPATLPAHRPGIPHDQALADIRLLGRYSRIAAQALDAGDRRLEAYLVDADARIRAAAATALAHSPVGIESHVDPANVAARLASLDAAVDDREPLVAAAARLARARLLHAAQGREPGAAELEWILELDQPALRFAAMETLYEALRHDSVDEDLRARIWARLAVEAQRP